MNETTIVEPASAERPPVEGPSPALASELCAVPGCGKPCGKSRGLCAMHYTRLVAGKPGTKKDEALRWALPARHRGGGRGGAAAGPRGKTKAARGKAAVLDGGMVEAVRGLIDDCQTALAAQAEALASIRKRNSKLLQYLVKSRRQVARLIDRAKGDAQALGGGDDPE